MEVGQPIEYDFEKWTAEGDKVEMEETLAKIEEKGFEQTDCRASNFVCPYNRSFVMNDFEEVVKISS